MAASVGHSGSGRGPNITESTYDATHVIHRTFLSYPSQRGVVNERTRFRRDLLAWAEQGTRSFPWRDPDASIYEVFVAEFFLTQTPAGNVDGLYRDFLERFDSLSAINEATEAELAAAIEPIGFHNMRAAALKDIATEHDTLPETSEELQCLTRVGPYVANATLCFALERRLPILDRNVVRVYERLFGDEFPSGEKAQTEFAEEMLPESGAETRTYNLALLDFGAEICQKRDPQCGSCLASGYCDFVENAEVE